MSIVQLRAAIEPLRQTLLNHPIYNDLRSITALRTFMEYHVFAVWDFMSLLKALQQRMTCVSVPWLPSVSSLGSRLINEIVLGEETDEDGQGGFASHYQLYHRAMSEAGASTSVIDGLMNMLGAGVPIERAIRTPDLPGPVRQFVGHTFQTLATDDLCGTASAFTFGREDLLPDVFQRIVAQLNHESDGRLRTLEYYLVRHIQLDGDNHGPLAGRLIESLCGDDQARWRRATDAATAALQARIDFWDSIQAAIAGAG